MTLPSDRLQLLFERHLEFMVKLRTQFLNRQCFAYASEVDGLIAELHTELGNDRSLHESSTSRNLNETAVSQDTPSCSLLSISETCPVVDSSPTIPETPCPNSDVSSSYEDDAMLNAHEIVAATAHKETEIKSSSTPNAVPPSKAQHSAIEISAKSNDQDSQAFPENVSHASNDNLEPSAVLMDAVCHSDPKPTSDIHNKFDDYISAEPDPDLTSNVDPHHLVNLSGFPIECE